MVDFYTSHNGKRVYWQSLLDLTDLLMTCVEKWCDEGKKNIDPSWLKGANFALKFTDRVLPKNLQNNFVYSIVQEKLTKAIGGAVMNLAVLSNMLAFHKRLVSEIINLFELKESFLSGFNPFFYDKSTTSSEDLIFVSQLLAAKLYKAGQLFDHYFQAMDAGKGTYLVMDNMDGNTVSECSDSTDISASDRESSQDNSSKSSSEDEYAERVVQNAAKEEEQEVTTHEMVFEWWAKSVIEGNQNQLIDD